RLRGHPAVAALRASAAAIDGVLDRSDGRTELALIETQEQWAAASPTLARLFPLSATAPSK
ncbi:MAG TPA: hypothetical protein VEK14_05330, partial [Rhodomicrobium sp.]|nr:hypothetical protein [Rhodomicrobium sp.]